MALLEEFNKQGNLLFKHRGWLPVVVLVPYIYLCVHITLSNNYDLILTKNIIGLIVSLFGLAIRCWTVGYTPANTSGRNTKEGQVADTLNQFGIYSILRHPLYFANYIMYLGIAISLGNVWSIIIFSLIFWIYYERIMFAEEQFLREKFGKIYTDWANNTNAFIPNFRKYTKPTLKFSVKKVLKKEKDGLILTVLIFTLIDIISQLILYNEIIYFYFIVFFCVTFVVYTVLKLMKHKTDILNEIDR